MPCHSGRVQMSLLVSHDLIFKTVTFTLKAKSVLFLNLVHASERMLSVPADTCTALKWSPTHSSKAFPGKHTRSRQITTVNKGTSKWTPHSAESTWNSYTLVHSTTGRHSGTYGRQNNSHSKKFCFHKCQICSIEINYICFILE